MYVPEMASIAPDDGFRRVPDLKRERLIGGFPNAARVSTSQVSLYRERFLPVPMIILEVEQEQSPKPTPATRHFPHVRCFVSGHGRGGSALQSIAKFSRGSGPISKSPATGSPVC